MRTSENRSGESEPARTKTWRHTGRKNAFNSCYTSPVTSLSSSPQNSRSQTRPHSKNHRELPLRSLNVDLSQFLKKDSPASAQTSVGAASPYQSKRNSDQQQQPKLTAKNEAGCRFCIVNGEPADIYMSHPLKDALGKNVCPMLRACVCPQCGKDISRICILFRRVSRLVIITRANTS